MRQDQFERLQNLTEKLTDEFLKEADPETWPGAGISLEAMDKQTRGDRYWSKKNAAATLSVIMRTVNLVGIVREKTPPPDTPEGTDASTDPEADFLDRQIDEAEKDAKKLMDEIQRRARKAEFDKKVHGKS